MSMSIAQQMQQLYSQFGELTGVTIELHKNLLAVQIENNQASATVFLQGAQVSHYQLRNQQPIIWCSPECDYQEGNSLRGGIPICWPWFGDLSRNPTAVRQQIGHMANVPTHGFVRKKPWQLTNVEILSNELTRLTLTLSISENEYTLWPNACLISLTVLVGCHLSLQLNIKNLSPKPVTFSTALHSYFAVSDINQVAVNGLEELEYIDCLDSWNSHTQQGCLTIEQEIDRIYKDTHSDINLVDKLWNRVITVQNRGSNSAVIWNPWTEKAKRLSQFSDDAYKEMLCIETANIDDDCVLLPSEQSYQLELIISQQTLS